MDQLSTGDRLHQAALRLFATYGFEGTGIRKIAQEAGISVASLYHYVGTKEDLLERMMRESMTELLASARQAADTVSDPAERVRALVDLHVRRHAREAELCRVGDTELRSLSGARRAAVVALRDEYQAIWAQAISGGVRSGAFAVPDVDMATLALVQMCTGVAHWYSPAGRLSLDEISAAFVAMTLALLGAGRVAVAGQQPGHRTAARGPRPAGTPLAAEPHRRPA